jgi:hypothetical protein
VAVATSFVAVIRKGIDLAYPLLTLAWCSSLVSERPRCRGWAGVTRLAWLALIAGSACYTSPINRAPTVSKPESIGDIFRGQPASFTADAMDPDADPVTISWAYRDGACPDANDRAAQPAIQAKGSTFPVASPDHAFCIWAFATDSHQATDVNNNTFTPRSHPPVAVLDLANPDLASSYPLNTSFVFSRQRSFDPEDDPIEFEWSLTAPTGFTGELSTCDALGSDANRCLRADFPGRYVVTLTVNDESDGSQGRSTAPPLTLDVAADQPPCIDKTSPPFGSFWVGDPTRDATFSVAHVDDDGDPQELHFTWFYGRINDPWTIVDNDFPGLNIKADTFQVGDEADVRVEIRDRPNQVSIDNALLVCGNEALCSAQPQRPTCFQRVTWKVKWNL